MLRRLRASEKLAEHVAALCLHHLRLGFLVHERPLDRRAVYRYLRATEPFAAEVTVFTVADRLATRGRNAEPAIAAHLELARELLGAALARRAEGRRAPLVRGDELARELGIAPGPRLGELLEQLEEDRFAGAIATREDAIARARELAERLSGRARRTVGQRLALAGLVLLAGCGGEPAPPRPARRRRPLAPRRARRPRRRTAACASAPRDGRRLRGELTPAARRHARRSCSSTGSTASPRQWDDFVGHLHRAGFATLAYASRSDHEPDEAVLARDLTGAVRALRARPEVDPDRIVLAGASVGGSTVAYALGTQPDLPVRGGVGFSAIEGPREVALAERHAFRPHDLLLVSDQREAQSARDLRADAHGKGVAIYVAEATGHGVALLSDASVRARAIAWLTRLTA